MLCLNTASHFDTRAANDSGYTQRKVLAAQNREIDVIGRFNVDLLFQNWYLSNGIEVRLRLIQSNDNFSLHGYATLVDCKVFLKKVTLFVRKVKPNASIQLAHKTALR